MAQHCAVLLKHGEVALKGRNRGRFEDLLHRNLRRALDGLDGPVRIRAGGSVTVLSGPSRWSNWWNGRGACRDSA